MSDALDLSRLSRLIDSVTGPTGGWLVSPAEFTDRLDRCVRDLLSAETRETQERLNAQYDMISEELIERAEKAAAETQQIMEERDAALAQSQATADKWQRAGQGWVQHREQLVAETQALREALEHLRTRLLQAREPLWAEDVERVLERLTTASTRTGETHTELVRLAAIGRDAEAVASEILTAAYVVTDAHLASSLRSFAKRLAAETAESRPLDTNTGIV